MVSRRARQRSGASRLGCLMQLIIVGVLIYFAAVAGEEALVYYRFQDAMKNEARFAYRRTDQQIKDHLRAFTDSVKLPLAAKDIFVARETNHIRIWAEYDQEFKLPWNKTKIVHLKPHAEKSF